MEEKKFNNKKIDFLRRESSEVRGRILEMLINVELLISVVLVNYFSDDSKREDLFKYVFSDKLDFDTKKNIFSSLKKNKKIKSDSFYKGLITDIDYLQFFRNKMAHSILHMDVDYVNNFNGTKILYEENGIKNNGKLITIITGVSKYEDVDNLIYSEEMILTRANRVLTAIRDA